MFKLIKEMCQDNFGRVLLCIMIVSFPMNNTYSISDSILVGIVFGMMINVFISICYTLKLIK